MEKMEEPLILKKYFPVFVTVAICTVAALIYYDRPNTDFRPYVDLTLNVHWDPNSHTFEPVNLVKASDESDVGAYRLGFITDAGSCNPAWGGQADFSIYYGWAKKAIADVIANDVEVTITLGSHGGIDISNACTDSELFAAYEKIIETYHPYGLDFDIENNTANVEKITSALAKIKKKYPATKISFTLQTLPDGLPAFGQSVLQNAKNASLDYTVNILAMNFGASYTGDMAQYTILAIQKLHQYLLAMYPQKSPKDLWAMIEVTPMIGINNLISEKFTLSDADKITNYAKHFGLGGTSMQLANRDFPCAINTANNYCSGDNLQTKPYEYEEHFLK
jgi:chitinase